MPQSIARTIDHSLLHPTLTDADLDAGCELARTYGVASVCVKPYAVPRAAELLAGSGVRVGTVVGFPHGGQAVEIKAAEADLACRQGAVELDMVVNIGKVLGEDWDYVEREVAAVIRVARTYGALVKVIFENDFLPDDRLKVRLCEICQRTGADYVKTSTGFGFVAMPGGGYGYRGATEADLALMVRHSQAPMQVKAAGGVRTYDQAVRCLELGVSRIGASQTQAMIEEERQRAGK